jgi:crossover junction endodeoxyribonuclease RuvC
MTNGAGTGLTTNTPRVVRILGIDPGSIKTGYGVIDMDGNRAIHVANGIIELKSFSPTDKLGQIHRQLSRLIKEFNPSEAAIERVFMHRNADSALKLGQARGAAIVACTGHELEIFEYTANQVKQATVGKGHAAKQQVQHMVKILLCLEQPPKEDAADALANAICHGHSRGSLSRMTQVKGIRRGRLR